MTSSNEIYVFCAGILKPKAHFNKFLRRNGTSCSALRNLIVLAKGTSQRTAGKKNRAASAMHRNKRFFAKVKARKRNADFVRLAAKACFPGRTVCSAPARTLGAGSVISVRTAVHQSAPFCTITPISDCKISSGRSSAS